MFKLLELGWKKYHLSKYFTGIIIFIMATYSEDSIVPSGFKVVSGLMFSEYIGQMPLLNILFKTILTIVLAIILLRLLINEYKNSYGLPIFNILNIVYIIMH
ncbi:hypothetical protein [Lysinibacillus sp. JNUCC 51]|uniref:hypothetical protein n=1 Tax=Lysinibacillus sp. JNUCC-51 TaxID=2792479 RepID=UPI0019364C16|nr:hypothetical protein JNUCC51_22750 [Lysinibacillus sp. JNUCC-51]